MVATVALFLEYEAVLTRPEHLAKAGITVAEAEIVLDVLAAVAEPVEPHFLWRPIRAKTIARQIGLGPSRRVDYSTLLAYIIQ